MFKSISSAFLVVVCSALLVPDLSAQQFSIKTRLVGDEVRVLSAPVCDDVIFDFGSDGMKFGAFIELASKETGLAFTYDRRQIDCSGQLMNLQGKVVVKRKDLARFAQEVLLAHDMVLIRMGGASSSIVQIARINSAPYLKQRAMPMAWERIDECSQRPAEIFNSVVPLENVDCEQVQRMLQQLIQEHRVSMVMSLPDANAVMICGTGRQMMTFAAAIRSSEQLAASERAKAWRDRSPQNVAGPRRAR